MALTLSLSNAPSHVHTRTPPAVVDPRPSRGRHAFGVCWTPDPVLLPVPAPLLSHLIHAWGTGVRSEGLGKVRGWVLGRPGLGAQEAGRRAVPVTGTRAGHQCLIKG